MILVTGAAGKSGQAIIRALRGRESSLRALVHREGQRPLLERLGVTSIVVGDMRDGQCVARAMAGVRALYLIAPNVSPDERAIGRLMIDAARAAGVERIVYHSVFHPAIEAMPHHWLKMQVEADLFASGLPYTILQPAPYMQNIDAFRDEAEQRGTFQVPYSVTMALSSVDLEDVAEVAARALTEPGHHWATYELCGGETLSARQIAARLGERLGRRVEATSLPLERWEARARARGLGDYQVETLLRMFRYYDRVGYTGSPNMLTWLLGRPPTSFDQFLARTVQRR